MAAALVSQEEFAIALEGAIVKGHMVIVIVTMKGEIELVEAESLAVFGIALGFFTFPDQSIVHSFLLLKEDKQKGTRLTRVPYSSIRNLSATTRMAALPICLSIASFHGQVNRSEGLLSES
jgi:hypothetical protein